jgi:hypothetical protein
MDKIKLIQQILVGKQIRIEFIDHNIVGEVIEINTNSLLIQYETIKLKVDFEKIKNIQEIVEKKKENSPVFATEGIELINNERREQIEKHKFTFEYDDKFKDGQLIQFADFILFGNENRFPKGFTDDQVRQISMKSRVEQLIIAGSLITADIDRRLRKVEK